MSAHSIYLDHNATTPLSHHARAAMLECLGEPLNPSSLHSYGRKARKILEHTRNTLRKTLDAPASTRVIFTSSATEANNLILQCNHFSRVLISATEHPSIQKARPDATPIPVDKDGLVRLDALASLLANTPEGTLVSILSANNETGVIQPLETIARIVHSENATLHSDAVQAFGKIPFSMHDCMLDAVTLSAHKIGGPQGVGALILNDDIPIHAQLFGGGQEQGYRAGTENVAAIHGFLATLHTLPGALHTQHHHVRALRDHMETEILALGGEIIAQHSARIPNTASLCMPGIANEIQLIHFDLEGIAVSAGSACSSGKISISNTLTAMGIDDAKARCVIRASLGIQTTEADIQRFLTAWKKLATSAHG